MHLICNYMCPYTSIGLLVGRRILDKGWPGFYEIQQENMGPPAMDDLINGGDRFWAGD